MSKRGILGTVRDASDDDDDHVAQLSRRDSFSRKDAAMAMALAVQANYKRPAGWVLGAGCILACCAGIVDVVALLETGNFVSHVTGTTAKIAVRLEEWHMDGHVPHRFWEMVGLVGSFIVGSILCGLIIVKNEVSVGRSLYGLALILNSLLLFLATTVHFYHDQAAMHQCALNGIAEADCKSADIDILAEYLAAMACGLQNGLCTVHFGAVIRTTHVTGLATDLGLTLGRMISIIIRGKGKLANLDIIEKAELTVDGQKLQVFVSLGTGFICGCVIGAYLQPLMDLYAFLVPAVVTLLLGLVYSYFTGVRGKDWNLIKVKQLQDEVHEVDDVLEHCLTSLAQLKDHQGFSPTDEEDDDSREEDDAVRIMEDEVQRALKLIHEVEDGIRDIAQRRKK